MHLHIQVLKLFPPMSLARQGGGGCYYVYCFLQVPSKGELHRQKPFIKYWKLMNAFECLICYNFFVKHPSKTPFCTAYCLICTSFCMHIGCSHSWAHALSTFSAFYPGTSTWTSSQNELCICTYTIRATSWEHFFSQQGFFPLNKSGVSTTFFFSTWTLCT